MCSLSDIKEGALWCKEVVVWCYKKWKQGQASKIFTSQEKNIFVRNSYAKIIRELKKRSKRRVPQGTIYAVDITGMDQNETIIHLFRNGNGEPGFRLVLAYPDGENIPSIIVSSDMKIGNKTDYHERYFVKAIEGKLLFVGEVASILGGGNPGPMDINALAQEIWDRFVQEKYWEML